MQPTRFEFVEGSSSKFWEVSTDGALMRVRFGRIGTDGVVQEKTFASPAAAAAEADKLAKAKVRKGYVAAGERMTGATAKPVKTTVAENKSVKAEKPPTKAAVKPASAKELEALKTKLADLVPKVFDADLAFRRQAGLDDSETIAERLGEPTDESDITALEETLGVSLPPSYRAFLLLYSHWRGFVGGANLLGVEDFTSRHVLKTVEDKSALFEEFATTNPLKRGAIPLAIGDARGFILMEPSKRAGQMDFVRYELTEEERRYPDLVALLEDRLKTTLSRIKKPKGNTAKLDGLLGKLAATSSTGLGPELAVKWKGAAMESIDLRSEQNGAAVAELVKTSSAKAVRELTIGGASDFTTAVKHLNASGWPASVERLSLGHQRSGEMLPGVVKIGDVAPALNAYAKLSDVDLTLGLSELGKLDTPNVERLTLRGCTASQWATFAAAKWPKLKHLELCLAENPSFRLLGTDFKAPKLTDLAIHLWRNDQVEPLATALAASPFLPQLRVIYVVVREGDEYLEERLTKALATAKARAPKVKVARDR